MRAKLKKLFLLDSEVDLEFYCPEKIDNFCFWLRAMIGPENQEGSESFDIQVCTPKGLKIKLSNEGIIFGRHILIVDEYNRDKIKQKLIEYCDKCIGDTWQDITPKLSRIGYWEFEDYERA